MSRRYDPAAYERELAARCRRAGVWKGSRDPALKPAFADTWLDRRLSDPPETVLQSGPVSEAVPATKASAAFFMG